MLGIWKFCWVLPSSLLLYCSMIVYWGLCFCSKWLWFWSPKFLFLFCRHFLFKHGSGSSAIFSAASQNYPLTSNTVYSPPPRPLPRSTFSRPAFTFNKPYRCCNWKCTALSATAITVTLALLLAYVIGKPFLPRFTFLLHQNLVLLVLELGVRGFFLYSLTYKFELRLSITNHK